MNLIDRLRGTKKSLAATGGERRKSRPITNTEIGVAGDFNALYAQEEARQDDITISDYRKMLDNDGTVEAIYNLLTLPIKGARYDFQLPEDVTGGDAELQLVKDNFTLPPHMGGMTLPFDLFIADMCRSVAEGFRLYEKVWTLKDGKFVYRKLAPRDSETVKLLRDPNGGFNGARQQAWSGLEYTDVTIPVERCFLFTYAKERSFLYGRSAFKSAHYHYDRKHKLYYIQQLSAQAAGLPPRKLKVPSGVSNNTTQLEAAEAAADKFGVMQRITLPEGYELEEYKTNPMKLEDAINHHDTLIARSVLAQFLVLAGSSTGSYSLGESDKENFMQALKGVMKQMEHHINAYLIPDLIDYNFASGIYPEFRFEAIDDRTKEIMSSAFDKLLTRPDLPGYVIEGIAKQVAEELGLETEEEAADDERNNSDRRRETVLADKRYHRNLTDAERRVNLSELSSRLDRGEDALRQDVAGFYGSLKDDALKRLQRLLEKGDLAAVKKFQLGSFAPYRKKLEEGMMSQYLLGKRTAADEVKGKIPQTPSKSRQYITTQAQAVTDKQQADLTFAVVNEVTKELRTANLDDQRNLGWRDILARAASVWAAFETNVDLGLAVTLAGSLNLGRGDSFLANDGQIDRMQYSALLDGRTTSMCRDLDNSVVSYEEYRATKWIPPCHFRCRSIWVAILKDDAFKPEFRPIPARPGGHTEPQL